MLLALGARLHCALILFPLEYFRPLGSFIFQSLLKNMYIYFLPSICFLRQFFPGLKVLFLLTLKQERELRYLQPSGDYCAPEKNT